ncbi:MAG: DUF4271 domain-containing protein [Hymenobacteraceae bacterium]|nr:DUF4271 domain-containing protein [Hymenobacteraceae bacterium]
MFVFFMLVALAAVRPLQAQVLPLDQKNAITGEWLVSEAGTTNLVPYVANVHTSSYALHQWLSIAPSQPFMVGFTAQKGLSLFLNNQLIFKADSASTYTVDLSGYAAKISPVEGKFLLTAWHPTQQPNTRSFHNQVRATDMEQDGGQRPLSVRVREYVNQNAFILFLLLIGLIYGGLRTSYPADFKSVFRLSSLARTTSLEEGFLAKPISSWSSVLFVLAFSLSFALLIAAIHTNVQHVRLFNRLFPISEADITTKIVFYTVFIFAFILLKYLFLKVLSFIFGLEEVVQLQYREFVRTILFLGIFLPVVLLLYLSLNAVAPDAILLVSNIAVSLLLVLTIMRVFSSVNQKAPVLNLHLFSYLCATEVIPLAIILKLIVLNF